MASGKIKNNLIDAFISYTLTKGANVTVGNYAAYKVGNMVFINAQWSGACDSNDAIFTIPQEIRPSSSKRGIGMVKHPNGDWYSSDYIVNASGQITQNLAGAACTNGTIHFMYTV